MRKTVLCSLIVVLFCSLHGQAQTTNKSHTIVCIGDSITAGYGTSSGGYPDILQDMFGPAYRVLNYGYSGAMLGKRDKGKLGELHPEVITIMLGTNDAWPQNWNACKTNFLDNYRAFVDDLNTLSPKARVYLVLPIPRFDNAAASSNLVSEVIPLIRQTAEAAKVSVIDCYTPFLELKKLMGDGLHPGDAGQEILARIFYSTFTTVEKAQATVLDGHIEQYLTTDLSRRIRVTAHYTSGITDDTAIRDCRFSSPDPEIASVSSNGTLAARAPGAVHIRLEMPGFSDTVTLQVVPNRTPPGLESAYASNSDSQKVTVVFTEPVEKGGAENVKNYALDNGASVTRAVLADDERTVTLGATPLTRIISYTLSVSGVKDKAGNAAAVKPAMKFKYLPLVPLLNPGFEYPVVPPTWPCNGVFLYAPTNADWTFAGDRNYGSIGIDRSKSGAPEGFQFAHLNMGGSVSQTVHFEFAGAYDLRFIAAARLSYGSKANIQVYIDDTKIADFLPSAKPSPCVFRFSIAAGDHKLMFAQQTRNRPGLGYLDDVRILSVGDNSEGDLPGGETPKSESPTKE